MFVLVPYDNGGVTNYNAFSYTVYTYPCCINAWVTSYIAKTFSILILFQCFQLLKCRNKRFIQQNVGYFYLSSRRSGGSMYCG
jgi:hypothetical protein